MQCGWRDSKPHGQGHRHLKPARLPIPPHPRGVGRLKQRGIRAMSDAVHLVEAGQPGLEPGTSGFGDRRYHQLSYWPGAREGTGFRPRVTRTYVPKRGSHGVGISIRIEWNICSCHTTSRLADKCSTWLLPAFPFSKSRRSRVSLGQRSAVGGTIRGLWKTRSMRPTLTGRRPTVRSTAMCLVSTWATAAYGFQEGSCASRLMRSTTNWWARLAGLWSRPSRAGT